MATFISILEWIGVQVLNYLLAYFTKKVEQKVEDIKRDEERGEINEANTKAYEDANDRAARIKAALHLLNRDTP